MTDDERIEASLARMAESDEDIGAEVYERFAELLPESAELMRHTDLYMRGRMLQDLFTLLLTPPGDIDQGYLAFEVRSHRAYGVTFAMFPPLLEAVRQTLRRRLGTHWDSATDLAWASRIAELSRQIATATES